MSSNKSVIWRYRSNCRFKIKIIEFKLKKLKKQVNRVTNKVVFSYKLIKIFVSKRILSERFIFKTGFGILFFF